MSAILTAEDSYAEIENVPEFSWRAVFAGAFVGSAVTVFLLVLGAGVGLSLISVPQGPAATGALTAGAIYFFASQAFGFAVGGYLTGRLAGPVLESEDEEIFLASAHGLAMWALTVIFAATITVMAGSALAPSGVSLFGMANPSRSNPAGPAQGIMDYWEDALFRTPAPQTAGSPSPLAEPSQSEAKARAEAGHILMFGLLRGEQLMPADHDEIVRLVAATTGASASDAARQVDGVLTRLRQQEIATAETARKAARILSLWLAASLIFGALVAAAAAVSGRWIDDEARAE